MDNRTRHLLKLSSIETNPLNKNSQTLSLHLFKPSSIETNRLNKIVGLSLPLDQGRISLRL